VDLFLAELGTHPERRRAGRLHYECARLLESPIGDFDAAAMHYREAHQLIPEHVPTLQGARRTLLLTRDANAVLPLIDAELSVASQSKHKALLLLEKGRLLEDELGNQRSAQVAFAKACELEKADLTLLRAAAVSEFKAESWESWSRPPA
jgi:tetratricopeptide (TPR) repeat protein